MEVFLQGHTNDLRDRRGAPGRLVAEARVELVRDLHRGPSHRYASIPPHLRATVTAATDTGSGFSVAGQAAGQVEQAFHVLGGHASDQLPLESEFGVVAQPAGRVAEIGRTIVASAYRRVDQRMYASLMARWRHAELRR